MTAIARTGIAPHFLPHLAGDHQEHHALVGPPGPQGMIEGRGHVVFDKKMRNPGETVGDHDRRDDPPPTPFGDCSSHQHPSAEGPN